MGDSYMKVSFFKNPTYNEYEFVIDGVIYFEDKEHYILTSQFGARWRSQPNNFKRGDENDPAWRARIHSYCDKILDRIGQRRRDLEHIEFQTRWHPYGAGGPDDLPDPNFDIMHQPAANSYRTFHIEMITDVRSLPRNRLPF